MRLARATVVSCTVLAAGGGLAATSLAAPSGTIATVAGSGSSAFGGDGQAATAAALKGPADVAASPDGGFLIADTVNHRIRAVAPSGVISTVAGTGASNFTGEGGLATAAALHEPSGVASLAGGAFLVADTKNHRIRRVEDGRIVTVAGSGASTYGGDGGRAVDAALKEPMAVAPTADGGFLIADSGNDRIRKVSSTGFISTFAGTGSPGSAGDGGAATAAELRHPSGVAVLADGDVLIADTDNDRIRRVDADTGTIGTVAGGGLGPAGSALAAVLNRPRSVVPAGDGGFALSDTANHRVGLVRPDGTATLLAGTGSAGSTGDGGPATTATLDTPAGLAVDAAGRLLVADPGAHRVRRVDVDLRPTPPPTDPTPTDPTPTDPTPTDPTPTDPTPTDPTPTDPAPTDPAPTDPAPTEPTPTDPTPTEPAPDVPAPTPAPAPAPEVPAPAPGEAAPASERAVEPTPPPAGPAPPALGRRVVVAPASGQVLVRRPGTSGLVPLRAGQDIPVGSLVDATRGTVRLTSALPGGGVQTARFWGSAFAVTQARTGDGTTELALRGGSLDSCPRASKTARTAAKRRKAARRLWGDDKGGRFRTRGRNSVATVRGTRWLTQDTCAGTLTRVVEGAVDVRDLHSGTVRRVSAGGSLLVRPGKR